MRMLSAVFAGMLMLGVVGAEPVDPLSGDWEGALTRDGTPEPLMAQVIALGKGAYRANMLAEFDTRNDPLAVMSGTATASGLVLSAMQGENRWKGDLAPTGFMGSISGSNAGIFLLKKVERPSPTLGKTPPEGASVLFDGSSTDAWHHQRGHTPCKWELIDGAMVVTKKSGTLLSKQVFKGDHQIHVEFRSPFQPEARGQRRGNSGVYVQGMFEVQILDSYGLEGRDNECGGIYKVGSPRVNMCAPPMQWQTYDIDFTAPTFDANGVKQSNARMTVVHNGVEIHTDREIPGPTAACSTRDEKNPNGLHLQDHGNPVQFRNIWVVE